MAKRPNVQIKTPGTAAHATETGSTAEGAAVQPVDDRVALTVKVSPRDYERLQALKGRRREPVQRIVERAVRELLDNEGV